VTLSLPNKKLLTQFCYLSRGKLIPCIFEKVNTARKAHW